MIISRPVYAEWHQRWWGITIHSIRFSAPWPLYIFVVKIISAVKLEQVLIFYIRFYLGISMLNEIFRFVTS